MYANLFQIYLIVRIHSHKSIQTIRISVGFTERPQQIFTFYTVFILIDTFYKIQKHNKFNSIFLLKLNQNQMINWNFTLFIVFIEKFSFNAKMCPFSCASFPISIDKKIRALAHEKRKISLTFVALTFHTCPCTTKFLPLFAFSHSPYSHFSTCALYIMYGWLTHRTIPFCV